MRDASPKEIDTRQGSITFDLLSPAAIELAHAYIELDQVLKFGFVGPDQPSEYLDLRAGELGLTRRPSVKAEGKLEFSGDDDTIIPEGTAVSTDEEEAVVFVTAEPGIIKQKKATVKAAAAAGGNRGNVDKGRIKLVLGNLSGIVTVTNPEEFVNGAETESDESLLVRYFDRVRRPATSGNAWHYRQWALEVRGVGDVKVFPVWNGGGTVKLCVLSEDKIAPNPAIVQDVREAVDARRPVGASVTVVPAQEVKINVTANVTLASGAVLANVNALFSEKLKAFLADLAFQSQVVPYNRIFGLLLDIEVVTDFKNLTINGAANQNLNIGDEQVAVAGTVNFVV
nr:baseplate J/gp47 family protein [Paenibacillus rhizolycopersici]